MDIFFVGYNNYVHIQGEVVEVVTLWNALARNQQAGECEITILHENTRCPIHNNTLRIEKRRSVLPRSTSQASNMKRRTPARQVFYAIFYTSTQYPSSSSSLSGLR